MQWAVVELGWTGSKWLAFASLSAGNPWNRPLAGLDNVFGFWRPLFPTLFVDRMGFIEGAYVPYATLEPWVQPWPWQV